MIEREFSSCSRKYEAPDKIRKWKIGRGKKTKSTKTADKSLRQRIGISSVCPLLRHCFTFPSLDIPLSICFPLCVCRVLARRIVILWRLLLLLLPYRKIPNSLCFGMLRWNGLKKEICQRNQFRIQSHWPSTRQCIWLPLRCHRVTESVGVYTRAWACAYLIFGLSHS